MTATLKSLLNPAATKTIDAGDPVRVMADGGFRARLARQVGDYLELTDDDGKVLPDLWHVSQVRAY